VDALTVFLIAESNQKLFAKLYKMAKRGHLTSLARDNNYF
jgi:hypothetical protein